MLRDAPTLLLNGFMGSGKSTVGRGVARLSGATFVDLDEVITTRAGASIPAIFAAEGEPGFRRREADELARLLREPFDVPGDPLRGPPRRRVIALGGGALLDPGVRRTALGLARVVTLTARPETLADRTAASPTSRPLLDEAPDRLAKIREMLATREEAYAEAHARVPTDGRSLDAIVAGVLEAWTRPSIAVPLGTRSYPVRFARGEPDVAGRAVAELNPSQVFVVTDANVQRLWGSVLEDALARHGVAPRATVVLEPGEEHKRLSSVERALTVMVEAGADRDAVVVGHGGGVVTDIAGFTAATLLRGVRWVGLPTTLLSMVDASVGGKTGVDLGLAKNAVGAFHQPSNVVVDVARVTTETARAYASGLAEVVKSGCIGDAELFSLLEREPEAVLRRELPLVEELAFRSVAVKAAIVARDERESGDRALLNFGHTIGHALEAEGGFDRLTHGESVALGMVAAIRVGLALGLTDPALGGSTAARTHGRVEALLDRLGLPHDLDAQPLASALPFIKLDKKRRRGAIRFVFVQKLGEAVVRELEPAKLEAILMEPRA